METTAPGGDAFEADATAWQRSNETFSAQTRFLGLEVLSESEADDEGRVGFRDPGPGWARRLVHGEVSLRAGGWPMAIPLGHDPLKGCHTRDQGQLPSDACPKRHGANR